MFRTLAGALDPCLLFREAVGEPDAWQTDLLRCDDPRVLLNCCRQSGKSSTAAVLVLHTALFKAGSLTLLLSPSERQSGETFRKTLDGYRAAGKPVPTKTESALRLELANGSRVIALPGTEETLRGFSGVDLLVIDEAARVSDEAYYGVRPFLAVSGGRLIVMSTPKGKSGWFHNAWTSEPSWRKIRITANDCPRITAEFLEGEREALGPFFGQEYFCAFTDGSAEGFIGLEWLEQSAGEAGIEAEGGETILGVDVARFGNDATSFCLLKGNAIALLEQARKWEVTQTCGRIVQLVDAHQADAVRIDDGGVGGGVTDRLRELKGERRGSALYKAEISAVNFGRAARQPRKFANWSSEAWFLLAEKLRKKELRLTSRDHALWPALVAQLTAPAMTQDSSGRLKVESKESMRRRGIPSPDLADALLLALHAPSEFRIW